MTTIGIRTQNTYLTNEDQRWIGDLSTWESNESITIDRSAFNLTVTFPNGFIPSGVVLGKITATGLYGPYDNAAVDGREVAVGFLAVTVAAPTAAAATQDIAAALYWKGRVIESMLPTGHGLDAAGRTDLAAKFRFA
jgi:hypothetical protein